MKVGQSNVFRSEVHGEYLRTATITQRVDGEYFASVRVTPLSSTQMGIIDDTFADFVTVQDAVDFLDRTWQEKFLVD
ncbi:hypothetical protein [Alicyclobacillus acidoterrestris]|uniref:Uncharacterized protein n=1 Tax=Alicyclobacillus acidoterrestris (strain ATCC 49025 / DSM 3922 / CIP 106132 / NCIMB 13137 / GD3B) TaxID=1356854 RepID=T0BS41_ALIAG|nr:hypothetical protein [Alicyclobacillus acidoterrestris]EPZ43330.1 hypothetical protein N007_13610 [Alicyclobacillus acidoterrestris ATCC 49025]UNO47744.1 hypothetical protein K1I37_13730 [Alicyclobacillus acidoterrestris]GEO27396.1 hypothetical protein AAC03nite_31810 [Alicyclobacillus acidoterrestris]